MKRKNDAITACCLKSSSCSGSKVKTPVNPRFAPVLALPRKVVTAVTRLKSCQRWSVCVLKVFAWTPSHGDETNSSGDWCRGQSRWVVNPYRSSCSILINEYVNCRSKTKANK